MSKIFIFNFHRISDEFSPAYPPIPVKTFEKIIRFLTHQFVIIPQYDLLEDLHIVSRKDYCVLTFDDGYADFAEYAVPVLSKYKVPAVLHVVTDAVTTGKMFWTQRLNKVVEAYYTLKMPIESQFLPKRYIITNDNTAEMVALDIYLHLLENPNRDLIIDRLSIPVKDIVRDTKMLTWQDIIDLPHDFITIGSHTHSHNNLLKMSEDEAKTEMLTSFSIIKDKVGIEPLSIAYPNGQYNDSINAMAKTIGYKILYTCDGCKNKMGQVDLYHRANLYNREYWKNILKISLWKFADM